MMFVVIAAFAFLGMFEGPDYAPLRLYAGTWQIMAKNTAKPDVLVNDCAQVGRYFTCQQTVNGTPGNLLIFVPADAPGQFYTQNITPQGRATGRDNLQISGNQWTYSSRRSENGKTTFYRTVNTFSGRNRIHYEQAESSNGTDWTVKNSGDELRISANARQNR